MRPHRIPAERLLRLTATGMAMCDNYQFRSYVSAYSQCRRGEMVSFARLPEAREAVRQNKLLYQALLMKLREQADET